MTDLAGDLLDALDPVRLMRRLGLEPDGWQRELLRSARPRILANCGRQVGKSSAAGVLAAHVGYYQPGSLALLVAPSLRQSIELYRKARAALVALGVPPGDAEQESQLRIELGNGSRVIALPGSPGTIRGFSRPALVAVDEAAYAEDDLFVALRPMLATGGGRLILLSTPAGERGTFHAEWTRGGDAWHRIEAPSTACPRISAAFLAEERRALGPLFPQEYECRFVAAVGAVFDADAIRDALDPAVEPLWPLAPAAAIA